MSNNKSQEAHEQRIKAAIIDGRNRGVCDKDGNTVPRFKPNNSHSRSITNAFRNSPYWNDK